MTSTMPHDGEHQVAPKNKRAMGGRAANRTMPRRLTVFVVAVIAVGAALLVQSLIVVLRSPFNSYLILLGILTIASGRFAIKVPGPVAIRFQCYPPLGH